MNETKNTPYQNLPNRDDAALKRKFRREMAVNND